jgi:hypothetical protein
MIQPFRPFVIDHQTLSLEQNMQPGTAKSLPLLSQLTQTPADGIVISRLQLVEVD